MTKISWGQIKECASGWAVGYRLNKYQRNEQMTRQGRSHTLTAWLQMKQCNVAYNQVERLFKARQSSRLSSIKLRLAAIGTPLLIGWASTRKDLSPQMRRTVNYLQDHVGTLCLAITLVSTVGLFILKQRALALASLANLGLGMMERYQLLPERFRQIFYGSGLVISNLSGLFLEDKITRLFCLADLIAMVAQKIFQSKQETPPSQLRTESQKSPSLSLSALTQMNHSTCLKVNKSHIHQSIWPPIHPEVTLDQLVTLTENFPWEEHAHTLKVKLEKDERWQEVERYQYVSEIAYLKANTKKLVEKVKNRTILQGEPDSYERLEMYLRLVAQEVVKKDLMIQADILMRIGVEGGDYCGPGIYRVLEEIVSELILQAEGLTLQQRLLATLQHKRAGLWQSLYYYITKATPLHQFIFSYIFPSSELHSYHLVTNFMGAGKEFGIPHHAATNDRLARMSPFEQYVNSKLLSRPIQAYLWEGSPLPIYYLENTKDLKDSHRWFPWKWYQLKKRVFYPTKYDAEYIVEMVSQAIGTSQIPKYEIYAWWQEWINKQTIDSQQKERLSENLIQVPPNLQGELIETSERKIQPKFIKAMLMDMGILEVKES